MGGVLVDDSQHKLKLGDKEVQGAWCVWQTRWNTKVFAGINVSYSYWAETISIVHRGCSRFAADPRHGKCMPYVNVGRARVIGNLLAVLRSHACSRKPKSTSRRRRRRRTNRRVIPPWIYSNINLLWRDQCLISFNSRNYHYQNPVN